MQALPKNQSSVEGDKLYPQRDEFAIRLSLWWECFISGTLLVTHTSKIGDAQVDGTCVLC